jgi:hypothetical protein
MTLEYRENMSVKSLKMTDVVSNPVRFFSSHAMNQTKYRFLEPCRMSVGMVQWRSQEFFFCRGWGFRQELLSGGWGIQQIQLRTEGRQNGDLRALAP